MAIHKWHLKAVIQKCISILPYPEKVNHIFQKHVTKGVLLSDEHFGYKIQHAADHIDYANKHLNGTEQLNILELGTGWYPIVPIAMFLTNTGHVTSLDIQSWLSKESLITAIEKMKEWRADGRLAEILQEIDESRWEILESILRIREELDLAMIKEKIGLTALLIDARSTGLPQASFDLIVSNNTFEHVYPDILKGILKEFKRLVKKGGLMSHFIDLSDHFAHFDRSINIYRGS